MFNKKADAGLTAIVIILIALIFLGWLVNIGHRECKSNSECGEDYYCGSDFRCHEYPNIQRTITQVDYTRPALIIGAAIIIAAFILKYFDFRKGEKKAEEKEEPDKIYTNYPAYSHQYSTKSDGRE